MNRSTQEPSLLELTTTLTPATVSRFLASNAWNLEYRGQVKEVWRLVEGGNLIARIMLPLDPGFADHSDRFCDALHVIGRVDDCDADQRYERIVAAKVDASSLRRRLGDLPEA
ncbi:hypothetical protein [Streptosporangium sp. NPDC049078]|uniref:hypothetical protein n=1 Tax=Streptosporangium sp. NPDC049078 TaxID=3155767 RepID=UPI00341C0FA9